MLDYSVCDLDALSDMLKAANDHEFWADEVEEVAGILGVCG
jgi:hypothetical protein